jgi:hypothetical protein
VKMCKYDYIDGRKMLLQPVYIFGKYYCRICDDFNSYSKFDLAKHILRSHLLVDYDCRCGENYKLKGYGLLTHYLVTHDVCGFCFTRNCMYKIKRSSPCKRILYNAYCLEDWSHFDYLPIKGEDLF